MKRFAVLSTIGLMALLAACGGGTPKSSTSPTQSATVTRLKSTASIQIVSPTPNQVIHGSVLHVKVKLIGGTIVTLTTQNVTPTTGHIHVSIDGKIKSFYAGVDYDATGLTTGIHVLTVEFVMANHVPFDPRVRLSQTFRVA